MRRLTEKQSAGYDLKVLNGEWCNQYCDKQKIETCNECGIYEAIQKLAEYEDLEECGKLVLFPTNVYCIIGNEIREGFVFEVTYCIYRKPLYTVRYGNKSLDKHTGYLGSSVFLTKEEAEEALKKMQEE